MRLASLRENGGMCAMRDDHRVAVYAYVASTLLIALATAWGVSSDPQVDTKMSLPISDSPLSRRWDSGWYLSIVDDGYGFRPNSQDNVAFFPLYPIAVKLISLSGIPVGWSGFIVSHTSFFCALVIFSAYLRERFPDNDEVAKWALIAIAVVPAGFFFRFVYSESTFLATTILSMYLMQRRKPLWLVAVSIGLATAARPVGVALLLPFLIHLRSNYRARFVSSLFLFGPVCCWGLLHFMMYQWIELGDAFAFVKVQKHWQVVPPLPLTETVAAYAAWEPIWSVYHPRSHSYWANLEPHSIPFLSLAFWNPIAFMLASALTVAGYLRGILNPKESALAALLLVIPYSTRGYDYGMLSQARFASVVFPAYIVVAHYLCRLPDSVRWLLLALSTAMLCYFSCRFAAGYPLY